MNDRYEFVKGLRAIRDYRDDPLTDEDLAAILEAGRWTGSSKNRQAWTFVAFTDPAKIQEIAEFGDFTTPVRDSVATIVLVQEPEGYMFDIGRAAQNMMLAAESIGVASCAITFHRDEQMAEYLGLTEGAVARYGISLGYPTAEAKPRVSGGRKKAGSVVRINSY